MSDIRSKVAWGGTIRHSGDLDADSQNKLRAVLDEFGIALEKEAKNTGISIYAFTIFREFNLFCSLHQSYFVYVLSPSAGGFPSEIWMDRRNLQRDFTLEEINAAVQQRFGWTSTSLLQFPTNVLDPEFRDKDILLTDMARKWVNDILVEKNRMDKIVRVNPIFKGRDFLLENDLCFVLIPFTGAFFGLYDEVIKPTLAKNFRVMKANDIFSATPIMEDIWEYINKSRLIVADVTGKNPNVFYELGIAHTVGKTVIIITQDDNDVPFDLKHIRYIKYVDNAKGWQSLAEELHKFVETTLSIRP
jgi:hypothetical protein